MIDYAAIANDALAAIQEAGRVVVLARFAKTFDPVTGATSAITCTKGNIDCVVLPARKSDLPDQQSDKLIEAFVKGKLRKLIVAASGAPFEPVPLDVASFDSIYWEVCGLTVLAPAGTAVIYTLLVEKTSLDAATVTALNA